MQCNHRDVQEVQRQASQNDWWNSNLVYRSLTSLYEQYEFFFLMFDFLTYMCLMPRENSALLCLYFKINLRWTQRKLFDMLC